MNKEIEETIVKSFFVKRIQEVRRSISIFERPLVTSWGDWNSCIYANFNPKYALMSVTILRTYYNFCKATEKNELKKHQHRD